MYIIKVKTHLDRGNYHLFINSASVQKEENSELFPWNISYTVFWYLLKI